MRYSGFDGRQLRRYARGDDAIWNRVNQDFNFMLFFSRALLSVGFVAAGVNHFRAPALYAAIVPPYLPFPLALVAISGLAEIAGGVGAAIPRTRRAAGWGLLALLLAVFPANVYMATEHVVPGDYQIPSALLWARLPLQFALMLWVWSATLRD